jgi:hypothetical protein
MTLATLLGHGFQWTKQLAVCSLIIFSCVQATSSSTQVSSARKPSGEKLKEVIFDNGLGDNWQDFGWAPRQLERGKPARIDFSNDGGWIVAKPGLTGPFGALQFCLLAPPEYGDFLEVRVDSSREDVFPRIKVNARDRADLGGGWSEVHIPLERLNPQGLAFDRVIFRADRPVGSALVSLDKVGFTAQTDHVDASEEESQLPPPVPANMTVDCWADARKISPLIYGIAYDARLDAKDTYSWDLGATARRWGGNTASTYNWMLGHAWNTGNDWFFENLNVTDDPTYNYERFLNADIAAGVQTALTVPIMGWVAKDTESVSFPVSIYGTQRQQDKLEAGDGIAPDGTELEPGPPGRSGVAAPPTMVGQWVAKIHQWDQQRKARSVQMYMLDNEPMLWNSTHRDLHPKPTSYDELLERTLAYGTAVRNADPDGKIAGPGLWGWPAYFYSAVDALTHFKLNPDRLVHGNMPLLPWYLEKLHAEEAKTGTHILDDVDVHFYPMADGVAGPNGKTDPKTAALRIRSTRSLWDPTYVDESWIHESVHLIPRVQAWIDQYDPGLGITIGEYNFGAETHMSGGLAQAEALGRMGQNNVHAAFYWTYPPKDSPAYWAFRAYRNFDGHGCHFLGNSLTTSSPKGSSIFASRDDSGSHLVLIALNLDPDVRVAANIELNRCGAPKSKRVFSYSRDAAGLVPGQATQTRDGSLAATLPPYSITVFDLQTEKAGK